MLRGGVIGFGRMGLTHFSILNTHPNVALVAVCDSSGFILKNAQKYLQVETFRRPDEMIEKVPLDFLVVATPTAHHADLARLAIDKGLHVFVEKPFVLKVEQGQEILRLMQGKTLVNQVGYVLRFSDVFMQVKRLLDSKMLGELLTFKMEMNGPTLLRDARQSWRSKKSEGGGCLYDFASHSIDLINYLIGVPDKVVGTVFQSIHSAGVEDAISSTFLYDSGTRGNLLVNWSDPSYRKPTYHFEALGRKGKIIADLHEYRLFLQEKASFNGFTVGWNQRYVTDFFEPVRFYLRGFEFTRQLDHFVDCISQGKPSQVCSFEQAHQTDIVIERLREDAERRHF
ncbi:Gfo/Idh/MocA family oxidoreductase [Candidatus Bathyarchaeota archaeon]|nr:Gfo/Idh/MocA family oxidoreductase [Candidatus Bathyarchaeota archaeon]